MAAVWDNQNIAKDISTTHDLEAEKLLIQLDKGIRSVNQSEQCEAILRCSYLFTKHPFPVIINSAFIKLSNLFINSSNLVRLRIVHLAEQNACHIEKLISLEEITRKIYSVMHSNDSIARAITLKLMGAMAIVLNNDKNVQHSIINALDSNDNAEKQGAIYASKKFANFNKLFSKTLVSKIEHMIDGYSTSPSFKLQLIPIFQYTFHDASTVMKVRVFCKKMLNSYILQEFVIEILHTLTLLSSNFRFDAPEQVELLLNYCLKEIDRPEISISCLKDLEYLVQKVPQMFKSTHIESLFSFLVGKKNLFIGKKVEVSKNNKNSMDVTEEIDADLEDGELESDDEEISFSSDDKTTMVVHQKLKADEEKHRLFVLDDMSELLGCHLNHENFVTMLTDRRRNGELDINYQLQKMILWVLYSLSSTVAVNCFNFQNENLLNICEEFTINCDLEICALSTRIMCNVALYNINDNNYKIVLQKTKYSLFSIFRKALLEKNLDAIKICTKCMISLCQRENEYLNDIFDSIITFIDISQERIAFLLVGIAIAAGCNHQNILNNHKETVLRKLKESIRIEFKENSLLLGLCTLFLLCCVGDDMSETEIFIKNQVLPKLKSSHLYQLSIQCIRFGHFSLAIIILTNLMTKASDENVYMLLTSITDVCNAENILKNKDLTVDELSERLFLSQKYYQSAQEKLQCSSCLKELRKFQCDYIIQRCKFLFCLQRLLTICGSYQTFPPTAVSTAKAVETGHEFYKCEHILEEFENIIIQFDDLEVSYNNLRSLSFNADFVTLDTINLLQKCCSIIKLLVSFYVRRCKGEEINPSSFFGYFKKSENNKTFVENENLKSVYENIFESVVSLSMPEPFAALTIDQINLLKNIILSMTCIQLPLPKLFFQSTQLTVLKLNIYPHKSSGEYISLKNDSRLTIKVEGVIQHFGKKDYFRSIKKIQLSVNSIQESKSTIVRDDEKEVEDIPNKIKKFVVSHNDYFATEFILSFPSAGMHKVEIDTAVQDENGIIWNTGPGSILNVRSYDEIAVLQQQKTNSSTRAN